MAPPRFMRSRNNGSRRGGGFNPHRTLESHGPNGKMRGSAKQLMDQYLSQSRDAKAAGDRVLAESLMQHADHYHRVIIKNFDNKNQETQPQAQGQTQAQPSPQGQPNGRRPVITASRVADKS